MLSYVDDMLIGHGLLTGWSRDKSRPRKFVSKGAKPHYPKLHRGPGIVGPVAVPPVPQVVAQFTRYHKISQDVTRCHKLTV